MNAGADAWEGLLDPGEQILWQGRPSLAFRIRPGQIFMGLFGLFFASFALFWMVMASQAGGGFWMFGLLHFSVGAALAFAGLYGDTYRRRHSWYTLTDRRAFIATDFPLRGKSLKSYPITSRTTLELIDSTPGTIWFAEGTSYATHKNGKRKVGFQMIDDARHVYGLMRGIQSGKTAAT